jgi:hypothetical protein
VFTEALGSQRHHGRIALLVNEHSASAAEMVAAFAKETRLAIVVGTKTPGRLVATSGFKVGFGYRVALPVAAYYTWQGRILRARASRRTCTKRSRLRCSVEARTTSSRARERHWRTQR